MKILLAPSTIKAVCDLCLKAIAEGRAAKDAETEAKYKIVRVKFLWWKWTIERTPRQMHLLAHLVGGYPSEAYRDQHKRVTDLRAIARHKLTAGVLEVPDPYLSDIAQFLGPDEDARIW